MDENHQVVDSQNAGRTLLLAAVAAFSTYFCMYAYRKPFTAGVFENFELAGMQLKTVLVISQLSGYMLSKFLGIKIVSEMPSHRRAKAIVVLIAVAELALVGFAYGPMWSKALFLFLNGLPLGMIFGLVLSYLEGRKMTEALSAALCASFIISSGVVKSMGRYLVQEYDVSEFAMPMWVGLIFLPILLISVGLLQRTPPPDREDVSHRTARESMDGKQRSTFWNAYWPGLSMLVFVYVAITIVRTVRDDFAVEIWSDMGIDQTPSVFARSEMVVAIFVTAFNGMAIWIRNNVVAIRLTVILMCTGFVLIASSAALQALGRLSPFVFMVACGVGAYIPYVAFHTTIFERIVAASRHPANLVFLMYVADAIGYLGYAVVLAIRTTMQQGGPILWQFRVLLWIVSGLCIVSLLVALTYFRRKLQSE